MSSKYFDYEKYPILPISVGAGFISGYAFKSQDFGEVGLPVVKIKNIQNRLVTLAGSQCVPPALITEKLERFVLKNGDVLIAMTGQGSVGRVGRLQCASHQRPVMNQRVGKFLADETSLNKDYLYYVISSEVFERQLFAMGSGSGQPNLSPEAILSVEIPFPPYFHQVVIAESLNALDDRITLLRETNATLEAIAQALFKSWFVDFDPVRAKMEGRVPGGMDEATAALFPDSFEETELGAVPRGWRWGTLNDLASFQNGYAFKSKDWTDTGHPVVKIGDVKPGIIDLGGCSYVAEETVADLDRFRLSRGSLLVGMTGYVGETGLVPEVEPAAYLNQRVGRLATKLGLADLGYVYCAARSPEFKEFAVAQSHGSAQANVSGTSLMMFRVVIGPAPLLEQFNSVIAGILESVLANHEEAQILASLRDTLLPRLISGQLRLPDALDELEAA